MMSEFDLGHQDESSTEQLLTGQSNPPSQHQDFFMQLLEENLRDSENLTEQMHD